MQKNMTDEFDIFREDSPPSGDISEIKITLDPKRDIKDKETIQQKHKILLVDDDSNIRESLKLILEKNYNVTICKDGDEGILKFNTDFSAVILDIKMKGKSGFETFIEIKKKNVFVPIIFHSAYQDLKNPYEIMNDYRPFGYVIKDGDVRKLFHTLSSAVEYYSELNKNNILLKEIKKKEEQYRTLVNNLKVGVYRNKQSFNGKIIQANPALANILGYDSMDELMDRQISEHYENKEDRTSLLKIMEANGYCKDYELRLIKKDGSIIWGSITATAIKNSSGDLEWVDGILIDITEIKKTEQELKILMQDIQKLNWELEYKVKERTSELNSTMLKLNSTLEIIKEDLALAKKIQTNTLTNNFSLIEELTIYPFYLPMSEVGGDFYDINKVNDFTYRFFLADATGHGVQGAMITMAIKGIYDNLKNFDLKASEIMSILNNEFITKYGSVKSLMTGIIIDLNIQKHTLTYASAGHPPGVLIQNDNLIQIKNKGRIIGVFKNLIYESVEYSFHPSDRLYIFTDGIYEEFNYKEEEFGEDRLLTLLFENKNLSIKESIHTIINRLREFMEGKAFGDDITILGIEYK